MKDPGYGLRYYALVGAFGTLSLAALVQGLLPMLEPQSRSAGVTLVVRTDLGELKWTEGQASDYSALQQRGREVYKREGCWYCHSQYVRPVTGETRRWGPITQAGEYRFDLPHLFSTRRIGPDLSRVGLKYSDSWHLAHLWNPRLLLPDSIMPRYTALFDGPHPARILTDTHGRRTLEQTPATERLFDFHASDQILLTPNAEGLLYVPQAASQRGKYPVIATPNDEFTGDRVELVADTPDLRALVAYLQKLGTNRGRWRDRFEPQGLEATQVSTSRSEEWIAFGREVYGRRCQGCHGERGDGNGPAATFMHRDRPRNFTRGIFKFRMTPLGSLPDDGDLLRTITRGVRGTAMPGWYELRDQDRLAVIQYIKYVLAVDRSDPLKPHSFFVADAPKAPIHIGEPPPPSRAQIERGRAVWQATNCWVCHGQGGKGDEDKAPRFTDGFGFPISPANLASGRFKSGADVRDIFRTLSTGLAGTPMPSFGATVPEDDRWALAYYVLSLSAFQDPLTGEPLAISERDRQALNDPSLKASESRHAYRPRSDPGPGAAETMHFAGEAWALKRGLELVGATAAPEASGTAQGAAWRD